MVAEGLWGESKGQRERQARPETTGRNSPGEAPPGLDWPAAATLQAGADCGAAQQAAVWRAALLTADFGAAQRATQSGTMLRTLEPGVVQQAAVLRAALCTADFGVELHTAEAGAVQQAAELGAELRTADVEAVLRTAAFRAADKRTVLCGSVLQ